MISECCRTGVVARYEAIDPAMAAVAKERGGVALYCPVCRSRVTFTDGAWKTEGARESA